jgi:hypothetical protein
MLSLGVIKLLGTPAWQSALKASPTPREEANSSYPNTPSQHWMVSGNRVLFRTFSFILLTFNPLFAVLSSYFANSHIHLYLSIHSLMITGQANKKRIH